MEGQLCLLLKIFFATIKESEQGHNRYNVECKRPERTLPNDYIIDEEKNVKWNREQVAAHNKEVENAKKQYYQDRMKGHKNFCIDLKQAIQNDYNFTESQANVILDHLHNDGMTEDLDKAEELCEIVYDIWING